MHLHLTRPHWQPLCKVLLALGQPPIAPTTIRRAILILTLAACSNPSTAPGQTPAALSVPFSLGSNRFVLSAGEAHTCTIHGDKVVCWGYNLAGQLGSGIFPTSSSPKTVDLPSGFNPKQISAGKLHTCALGTNAAVYCWGENGSGQLGSGNQVSTAQPAAVLMSTRMRLIQIVAGNNHTCALDVLGKAHCWGDNRFGQLGNGGQTSSSTPSAVTMPEGVYFKQLSAGTFRTCALGSDHQSYCWGDNGFTPLGVSSDSARVLVPARVLPSGVSLKQISVGNRLICGLGSDGKGYCWGSNANGQLGDGTVQESAIPKAVSLGAGPSLRSVSAGDSNACALDSNGRAYCWGYGYGTEFPKALSMPEGVHFVEISTGSDHACALAADGKIYCWGTGADGQLGNGSFFSSDIPVPTLPF